MINSFIRNTQGNFALTAALVSPMLLGSGALAIDYTLLHSMTSNLQQAADSAALSGARELAIAGTPQSQVMAVSETYARSNLNMPNTVDSDLDVDVAVAKQSNTVTVDLALTWTPFFAHILDSTVLPIRVRATAGLSGDSSICTLALDPSSNNSISLSGNAAVIADGCSIQANSASSNGMIVQSGSQLKSSSICVSGGYSGSPSAYDPAPLTDCPAIPDPLSSRELPVNTVCNHTDMVIVDTSIRLNPGVYCGGIYINDFSEVELRPGVYTFKEGDLDVGGGSILKGNNVTLHFESNARLFFRNNSEINLKAPKTGTTAGLLIAGSPDNDPNLDFEIQSNNAKQLTGLIYTPANNIKLGDDTNGDATCDEANDLPRNVDAIEAALEDKGYPPGWIKNGKAAAVDASAASGMPDAWGRLPGDKHYGHDHGDPLVNSAADIDDTIGCKSNVGQYSEWTAIIARNISITAGVKMVLNADYTQSKIPVPANSGVVGARSRLVE